MLEITLPKACKFKPKPKVDWEKRERVLVKEVRIIMNCLNDPISRLQLDKNLVATVGSFVISINFQKQ